VPLFLEPNVTFPIVLESDEAKPVETRPTFLAKAQSMRGQQKVGETLDRWTSAPDIELAALFDETIETLSEVVVGWKNMGNMEYSKEALRELSYMEARELLRKVMFNQHLQPDEKKSSE